MERNTRVAGLSPLSRVKGLAPGLVKELERANIRSPADLLMLSDIALMHLLNISLYLARQVIQDVCNHVAPVPTTVAELAKDSSRLQPTLPSPLPSLDATLLGGLPPSIVEVTGAAGAGKTQFCMSCAAKAGIIGCQSTHGATVVYIDTEGALDPKRLRQILRELCGKDEAGVSSALASIFIVPCDTVEALQKFIAEMEELILAKNVSLLIVDSVASIIRRYYTGGTRDESIARSDTLARLAGSLKVIADTFRIPVIVTNQVTTKLAPSFSASAAAKSMDEEGNDPNLSIDAELAPALGTTWAHAVNTRLFLRRNAGVAGGGKLSILKSPAAPQLEFDYVVTASGIEETR